MWNVFKIIGVFVSAMSLFALVEYALKFGLSSTILILFDYYEQILKTILFPFRQLIEKFLLLISEWLFIKFELFPHWRHILVVLGIYLGSTLRQVWTKGTRHARIVNTPIAAIVWLGASISAGVVELGGRNDLLIAGIPILFLAFFQLCFQIRLAADDEAFSRSSGLHHLESLEIHGLGWFQRFRSLSKATFYFTYGIGIISMILGCLGFLPFGLDKIPSPGVAVLVAFIVGLNVHMFSHSLFRAVTYRVNKYTSWIEQFRADGTVNVARYMAATITGTLVFLIANAGLKLFGL